MRLTHLSLRGYYGFRELELPFPAEGPTVLIGKNGAGKSTVLDAIAIFLDHFVGLMNTSTSRRKRTTSLGLQIPPEQVHREASEARVLALFSARGQRLVARAVHNVRSWDLDEALAATRSTLPFTNSLIADNTSSTATPLSTFSANGSSAAMPRSPESSRPA